MSTSKARSAGLSGSIRKRLNRSKTETEIKGVNGSSSADEVEDVPATTTATSSSSSSKKNRTTSAPASPRGNRANESSGSNGTNDDDSEGTSNSTKKSVRRSQSLTAAGSDESAQAPPSAPSSEEDGRSSRDSQRPNVFQRMRNRSRSRSSSRSRKQGEATHKEMLVAVTSCRSDGYYNQKAPGSTFKLPRKAPTNLKLFHELAVGVKDAYAALGAVPKKPSDAERNKLSEDECDGMTVLWDFMGNLDFLLALVDEVSVDTVTRGALKDDSTFKGLRDVIKKGNRVLEEMLVRRERKYTLFFRLVQPLDVDPIDRIRSWNAKVEKVVGTVTDSRPDLARDSDTSDSDASSVTSGSTGSVSSRVGVFSRGRQLLPSAGRVRSRRATPTPRLRRSRDKGDEGDPDGGAAADGFSAVTAPNGLSGQQHQHDSEDGGEMLPSDLHAGQTRDSQLAELMPIEPKDELVDVIRGLRVAKIRKSEGTSDDDLAAMKPSWRPKAEIPSSVPKLPIEYVHRHRLMRQVVSCLLDETEEQMTEDGQPQNTAITCVTSRHMDKSGNGKSTLAVAVIQTVEVRERFCDGIAWLKLGRAALSEHDIRRLYEDLYRQLIVKEADMDASVTEDGSERNFHESVGSFRMDASDRMVDRADSVRRFQGGDLEGIKEDLGRMIVRRNILICLDDVWRVEDAKWFIFETPTYAVPPRDSPYKILITTRIPALLGNGTVQEVFVRILSEHEAVKLLLSTTGRRPYGGRNSAVFNQSKMIVKGCGNSPLAILLIGSMLRQSSRNWNLGSPVWEGVFNQCSLNLEEAAQLRSFKNAFTRIVDMSFFTIDDTEVRICLRRCFVLFFLGFHANDWLLSGKGIPHSIILKFFETVIRSGPTRSSVDPAMLLELLENLRMIQRARPSVSAPRARIAAARHDSMSVSSDKNDKKKDKDAAEKNGENLSDRSESDWDELEDIPNRRKVQHFFTMHDSLKAVAEQMGRRALPAFTPEDDSYTFFSDKIEEEAKLVSSRSAQASSWWTSAPLRFLFESNEQSNKTNGSKSTLVTEEKVHELVALTLLGGGDDKSLSKKSFSDAMRANQHSMLVLEGGEKFEEYAMSFLPEHLMHARALSSTAELLVDSDFCQRRVFALGIMEATGRQVADLMELRSYVGKGVGTKNIALNSDEAGGENGNAITTSFDLDATLCDASRMIVDEVYKVTNSMGTSDSLGMATCLATVGEALLKCRQPRDAMLRLEEAVSIYRGVLGPYHVYVAHALHSVAKALVKLGETRVALLKFAEAARIYETCNATLHYDSIANAQALAMLLVDIGDIRKAEAMFEEVIAMKQTVYGECSVPVAKTINSYAILLAKHGRMNDALRHYEIARTTYMKSPPSLIVDHEFDAKCQYDVTLISLNIASIYSKKGDLERALQCYEEGLHGLESYEQSMAVIREANTSRGNVGIVEPAKDAKGSSHKHIVAALRQIGSIKVKRGDNDGAIEAYMNLIEQVDDDSPIASHMEKAKAHLKCATIFRKREGENQAENHETAVWHLREALRMYKALYEPGHKDTEAIATTLKQWLAEDKQTGTS